MSETMADTHSARTVFHNAKALMLIQIANQLMPLIMVPYLTRVLGTQMYGVVAFGLALVNVATVVTDYGFNLSTTLQISKHRHRVAYVNRVIGAVFLSKTVLLGLVLSVLLIFSLSSEKYGSYAGFLALLSLPIVAQTYLPVWFFQGVERMGYIAIFTLGARIVYLVLVFTFVKSGNDYVLLAVINGASQTVALGLALILMSNAGYRPTWPGFQYSFLLAKHSTQFFWSRAAFSTYTAGATVFLGFVSNVNQVAYYSAADQLYRGAQSVFVPFSQALYPNMVRTRNFVLLFRIIKWSIVVALAGAVTGVFLGPWVIALIFGTSFSQSYPVLLILLVAICFSTPSVLLGYPLLGALGKNKTANNSVLIGGAIQLVLLGIWYVLGLSEAVQVALTVCMVEFSVLLLRIYWGRSAYLTWCSTLKKSTKSAA